MAKDGFGNPRLLRDAEIPRGAPGDAVVGGLLAYAETLRGMGRRRKARRVLAKAVEAAREYFKDDPLECGRLLAGSLHKMARFLSAYGKAGDALPFAAEAADLARTEGGGLFFQALHTQAGILRTLGRIDEAAACEAEAKQMPCDPEDAGDFGG
ncbi:tetratricopeptide repeat protein [Streptosporangiaceae bacterium NEAU-GS5]|nr:tetratricopeptide repeat protein [Streptosporangiaceae bacterium NEAU-GS5]